MNLTPTPAAMTSLIRQFHYRGAKLEALCQCLPELTPKQVRRIATEQARLEGPDWEHAEYIEGPDPEVCE